MWGISGGSPVKGRATSSRGVRWIRRGTSKDFLDWGPLENIDCGNTPWEHFYTNSCIQYHRAPGTYLMFPSRFVHERTPDPDWTYDTGVSDIVFMSSRDGFSFDRSFMEAFIRPGTDFNNWHDRGIYLRSASCTRPIKRCRCTVWRTPTSRRSVSAATRSERDGFVSVNAGFQGRRVHHAALDVQRKRA